MLCCSVRHDKVSKVRHGKVSKYFIRSLRGNLGQDPWKMYLADTMLFVTLPAAQGGGGSQLVTDMFYSVNRQTI